MDEKLITVGTGEHPVIALHGWFGAGASWNGLHPLLDGARFSYAFPDYRGFGARRGEDGEHTLAELAADVLALADRLGHERFSLIGHSMGGKVMQRVLADAPHRVRAMVGVSPVTAARVVFDEDIRELFVTAAAKPQNRRAIIDLTTGNRLTGTWLDAMVRFSVDNSDQAAFAACLDAWAGSDIQVEIEGSDVAVKVIVGEHDPALNEAAMRGSYLRWYPRCEVEVLGNAGHYAMDETPVALVTVIEAFLAGH